MADKDISIQISAEDKASAIASGVLGNITKYAKTAILAVGAIGIAKSAIDGAIEFETRMGNIQTLLGDKAITAQLGEAMKVMSKDSIFSLQELSAEMYNIVSAGIAMDDRMNVLAGSADLAQAGLGSVGEAVDLSTSAINAFQLTGEDATRAFNTMFQAVKYGKTTVSELSQGFGGVAAVAKSTGVSLEQLMAGVSALTTSGLSASEAYTQLKAVFSATTRANDTFVVALDKLNVKSFGELLAKKGDLVSALDDIKNAFGGNTAELIKALGSTEALNAIMGLTGANSQSYVDALNSMSGSTDDFDQAVKDQNETVDALWKKLKNELTTTMIEVATKTLPVISGALQMLNGDWVKGAEQIVNYVGWLRTFTDWVGKAVGVMGGFDKEIREQQYRAQDAQHQMNILKLNQIGEQKRISEAENTGAVGLGNLLQGTSGRANGGGVSAGTPYIVGERGQELFIPSNSGRISPNANGGITVNVEVSGNSVGNPDELAEIVSQKIVQSLKFNTQLGL